MTDGIFGASPAVSDHRAFLARSLMQPMTSPSPTRTSSPEDGKAHEHLEQPPIHPPRPLSGPGSSRHTRRLQLRNANFRGVALPSAAKASQSMPVASSVDPSSDTENVSPLSGLRAGLPKARSRESTGRALHEIATSSSAIKPKRTRPRVSSTGRDPTARAELRTRLHSDDINSPPPLPKSAVRLRAIRARTKISHPRRSISAEARKYVEHLEAELSAAHTEINAINSPSVTRVDTARMRHMNAETKQLQDELADWEAKFEERVREAVMQQVQVDTTLRVRMRVLETEAAEAQVQMDDLRSQLEAAHQSLEAIETANVNLEKRIEIMSELLVSSPSKIDLHAERPRMGGKPRPKSMLPRFPTAGTLIEHQILNQPSSPPPQSAKYGISKHMSLSQVSMSPDEATSEAESIYSRATMSSVNPASAEDTGTMPPPRACRSRMRRMRRFGAGSMGPKPLILPATSYGAAVPASAPAIERSETQSVFSFDNPRHTDESGSPGSPSFRRRRALTSTDELAAERSPGLSPFLDMRSPSVYGDAEQRDHSCGALSSPPSAESVMTTCNYSSLGSAMGAVVGRSLMDELAAAKTGDAKSVSDNTLYSDVALSGVMSDRQVSHGYTSSPFVSDLDGDLPSFCPASDVLHLPNNARLVSDASTALAVPHSRAAATPSYHHTKEALPSSSSISVPSISCLNGLISDFRYPHLALARHLIHAAHARMEASSPMLNIQWWLVGMLLGPMARRRMLGNLTNCASSSASCSNLLQTSPSRGHDENRNTFLSPRPSDPLSDDGNYCQGERKSLSYGDDCLSPSPAPPSRSSLMRISETGGKRASTASPSSNVGRCCQRHYCRTCRGEKPQAHSPWLWLKFSLTLAVAVGAAFRYGPGSLLATAPMTPTPRRHGGQGDMSPACPCAGHHGGRRRGGKGGRALLESAAAATPAGMGRGRNRIRDVFAAL